MICGQFEAILNGQDEAAPDVMRLSSVSFFLISLSAMMVSSLLITRKILFRVLLMVILKDPLNMPMKGTW